MKFLQRELKIAHGIKEGSAQTLQNGRKVKLQEKQLQACLAPDLAEQLQQEHRKAKQPANPKLRDTCIQGSLATRRPREEEEVEEEIEEEEGGGRVTWCEACETVKSISPDPFPAFIVVADTLGRARRTFFPKTAKKEPADETGRVHKLHVRRLRHAFIHVVPELRSATSRLEDFVIQWKMFSRAESGPALVLKRWLPPRSEAAAGCTADIDVAIDMVRTFGLQLERLPSSRSVGGY